MKNEEDISLKVIGIKAVLYATWLWMADFGTKSTPCTGGHH